MHNTLSNILSKIYIAEKKNKKIIILKGSIHILTLLNLLWVDGFIYGYKHTELKMVKVFLKHSNIYGYFSNIIFLQKQTISLKELKNLLFFNKNYYYLVRTSKGILSGNSCKRINIGGSLIAKF